MNFLDNILDFVSGGNNDAAEGLLQQNAQGFKNIYTPTGEDLKVKLQEYVNQGVLTPEEAQTYMLQDSEMSGVSTDPKLKQAQMDALFGLQDISNSGGLTAADQSQLSQIQNQEQTAQRGAREAILQNAQARGAGGSGMELLAQLQNQQDSATRQSQRDLDVAGMAQQRALQALQQAGSLGGQIQAQDFGQQSAIANAQDAINKFNTQNTQAQQNLNVGARNEAQAANLANKQNVSNLNTGVKNTQAQQNSQALQQGFTNQLQKQQGIVGANQNLAGQYEKEGAKSQKIAGGLLGAGMQVASVLSDVNAKEDIKSFDPSDFLDSLTSYKYKYKNPERHGEGQFGGIMAQDLEKTPEGAALVHDTPEGKMIDSGKGFGTLLAALSDMHNRVKDLEGKGV